MRNLRIPIELIKLSRKDVSFRDALVLSIAIKSNFSSSNLHYNRKRGNATCLVAMRSLFKCSHVTFNRMIANGIKHNLIRREGNYIIANPIRERGSISVCIPTIKGMSFQRIKRALDNVTYAYKIMCLNRHSYSIKMANGTLVRNAKDYKKFKAARKKVTESELGSDFYDMISYNTLSKVNNTSRLKAITDINSLVRKGTITKVEKLDVIQDEPLNNEELKYLNEDAYGFYFNKQVDGELKLVHQQANAYELTSKAKNLFLVDWSFDKFEKYSSKLQFPKMAFSNSLRLEGRRATIAI